MHSTHACPLTVARFGRYERATDPVSIHESSYVRRAYSEGKAACFGEEPRLYWTCHASYYLGGRTAVGAMAPETDLNMYMNDWLFIAPSATADSFSAPA